MTDRSDVPLADALAQLSFVVSEALAEIAGRHELSIIQLRLLGVLRDREPTMQVLGRILGLDKSSISGLVDRAERRGLVTRSASTTDRRAVHVSITELGRELAQRGEALFAERVGVLVAQLSAADRRDLARVAGRIVAAEAGRRGVGPARMEQ